MAKIKSVKLDSIPEFINVGDNISDILVNITIEFHKLDVSLQMEYVLTLFIYDINGKMDIPVIIENWDETHVYGVSQDRRDQLLGKVSQIVTSGSELLKLSTPMALKLGALNDKSSHFSRKLEVLASLTPAIGCASKWSSPFESNLYFN